MVTHDTLPSFIKNIKKEFVTTGRSLYFVTSEYAHGIMEKHLREAEAFHFAVECSFSTNQPTHFVDESTNEEEVATQIQQAIVASHEIARQEPYIPFKGKGIIKDDKPSRISKVRVLQGFPRWEGLPVHTRNKNHGIHPHRHLPRSVLRCK